MIVAMLTVAGAVWRYASSYADYGNPSGFRSFSVSGEGKVVAIPDVAKFSFSVTTEGGKNVGVLQADNTVKMNRVIEFVKSNGVEAKDIKTEGYSIEPRYQNFVCDPGELGGVRECPPPEIYGYTIRQNVSVKVRDFAKIGDVLSGIVDQGANSVSGLSFTIDDPTTLQAEAREEAIAKAKDKAQELAKTAGFRVGRLLSINEGGYYPVYERALSYSMGGDAAKAPSPTIEPGSQEVVVSVNLSYEIR